MISGTAEPAPAGAGVIFSSLTDSQRQDDAFRHDGGLRPGGRVSVKPSSPSSRQDGLTEGCLFADVCCLRTFAALSTLPAPLPPGGTLSSVVACPVLQCPSTAVQGLS